MGKTVRIGLGALALAGLVCASEGARAASEDGFSVLHFEPLPGGDAIFSLDGSAAPRHLSVYGGLWTGFVQTPLTQVVSFRERATEEELIERQLVGHLAVGLGLVDRIAIELSLPVLLSGAGDEASLSGVGSAAAGDIALRTRVTLLGNKLKTFGLAATAVVWLPSGSSSAAVGDGSFRGGAQLSATLRGGPVVASLMVGASLRGESATFRDLDLGHELLYGLGALVEVAEPVEVGLELVGRTGLDAPFEEKTSPLELVVGPRVRVWERLALELAGGAGLVNGYGAPTWRVFFGVRWMPEDPDAEDSDDDGLADDIDPCPDQAEDVDGHEDEDGCPDRDNDADTVVDARDRCPDVAGPPETVGCSSDLDSDGDGLVDALDKCPAIAAGADGRHGCPPDLDSDGDGLMDFLDRCPRHAAPGGCPPDLDQDGDGLLDVVDRCPTHVGEPPVGCPPDLDSDGDGLLDIVDRCPMDAAPAPGPGCPADLDSDGDGLMDIVDRCPDLPGGPTGCPLELDSDGDGILDHLDRCPRSAAPVSGCSDALDSDGDGLVDMLDRCPYHKGDEASYGCPGDLDSDGDGLLDSLDRCPAHAQGDGGSNGCPPDLDSDGDGLLDVLDRCPQHVQGAGGSNGCPPDLDLDGDGVLDIVDRCTNQREDKTGSKPDDGCLAGDDLKVDKCRIEFSDNVFFATGKSEIRPAAVPLLQDVAQIVARKGVRALTVEGHTDNVGGKRYNLRLSQKRADAVRAKLIELGVEIPIEAIGYGLDKPVASNDTNEGRAKNRRVDFTLDGEEDCK